MTPLIREPALEWTAGQAMTVYLNPLALPAGRALSDFSAWTLTIREDPEWPRTGLARASRDTADPIADAWAAVVTVAGTTDAGIPTFKFTMPTNAGAERYAIDIFGTLAAGGDVQLYQARWLTAGGRVK